jgi:hypothetical protein
MVLARLVVGDHPRARVGVDTDGFHVRLVSMGIVVQFYPCLLEPRVASASVRSPIRRSRAGAARAILPENAEESARKLNDRHRAQGRGWSKNSSRTADSRANTARVGAPQARLFGAVVQFVTGHALLDAAFMCRARSANIAKPRAVAAL